VPVSGEGGKARRDHPSFVDRHVERFVEVAAKPASRDPRVPTRILLRDQQRELERLGEGEPADLLLRPNVVEQDVVPFDRLHRSAGCLLYLGTNLTGLCVTELPGCLALPERHAESLPSFAVAQNDVTDIPGLAAYPWMDHVAHDSPHISDSVGRRLQDVHSRKHLDLQLAVVFP
jgi:hypothetical protein